MIVDDLEWGMIRRNDEWPVIDVHHDCVFHDRWQQPKIFHDHEHLIPPRYDERD